MLLNQLRLNPETSIQEFYVDAGYMDVDADTGFVRPTHEVEAKPETKSLTPLAQRY